MFERRSPFSLHPRPYSPSLIAPRCILCYFVLVLLVTMTPTQSFRPLISSVLSHTHRRSQPSRLLLRSLSTAESETNEYSAMLARRRMARAMNGNPDLSLAVSANPNNHNISNTNKTNKSNKLNNNKSNNKANTHSNEQPKQTQAQTNVNADDAAKSKSKSLKEKLAEKYSSTANAKKKSPVENSPPILFIPTNPLYNPTIPVADVNEPSPDRPFTLPAGEFRPKQSLGQNYLSDQNYVNKIVDCFKDQREMRLKRETEQDKDGQRVVEIGPGAGALTRVLVRSFPRMTAVEIDQRAVALLKERLPEVEVRHQDVLEFNWKAHYLARNPSESSLIAEENAPTHTHADKHRKHGLSIVANLPYHIVSQVLFSLADNHRFISLAVVTMQWEVAIRITAKPRTKEYGIPSVVFQLYGETLLNFKIPPTVFFPVPKVDSALLTVDFTKPHKELKRVHGLHLRKVLTTAFRQRRKMLRQSLKALLEEDNLTLPLKWSTMRPQELTPVQFIHLTVDLYGERKNTEEEDADLAAVWRRSVHVFD